MDRISSMKNPLIQQLRALKDQTARDETHLMLIEGRVMIEEALKCGLIPRYALFSEDRQDDNDLAAVLSQKGAQTFSTPRQVLDSVCPTKTPQGLCCAFKLISPHPVSDLGARIVALDGVQDPGNVGTIWRTADAAGFTGLTLGTGCANPTGPKVIRSAMGSAFRLPFAQEQNLASALESLRAQGYSIVVSALDGEDIYCRAPIGSQFVLIIGSEAHGASDAVKAQATHRVKLPMRGGAESLNAAVAAGILMYELTRTADIETV